MGNKKRVQQTYHKVELRYVSAPDAELRIRRAFDLLLGTLNKQQKKSEEREEEIGERLEGKGKQRTDEDLPGTGRDSSNGGDSYQCVR